MLVVSAHTGQKTNGVPSSVNNVATPMLLGVEPLSLMLSTAASNCAPLRKFCNRRRHR